MKYCIFLLAVMALVLVSSHSDNRVGAANAQSTPTMSFFVSSAKSKTGNLGGLQGADRICQTLATAVGLGNNAWRAYLSVERDPNNNNQPTDASSRIGTTGRQGSEPSGRRRGAARRRTRSRQLARITEAHRA